MFSTERLADVFVEVADTLVDEFDLIEFLTTSPTTLSDVTGATSAWLLLADQNGTLHYMAASSEGAGTWSCSSSSTQGPCLDCFRTRKPIITSDLSQETRRWPDFAPRAIEAGVRSVHAFPMRLRDG